MKTGIFKTVMVGLLMFFAVTTMAQQAPPVPIDPKVRYGKLENGLTYYIRANKLPKERAEFYIAQNVGAILENDDGGMPRDRILRYRESVLAEERKLRLEALDMLENVLLPVCPVEDPEGIVFLVTLQGDLYRYLGEQTPEQDGHVTKALSCYETAETLAVKSLSANSSVRIATGLNHAVCLFELKGDVEQAVDVAKKTLTEAEVAGTHDQDVQDDAPFLMDLLRTNLQQWTPGTGEVIFSFHFIKISRFVFFNSIFFLKT